MARKISPLLVDILVLITVDIRHMRVSGLSTVLRMTVTIIEKRATTALLQIVARTQEAAVLLSITMAFILPDSEVGIINKGQNLGLSFC